LAINPFIFISFRNPHSTTIRSSTQAPIHEGALGDSDPQTFCAQKKIVLNI